MSAKFALVSSEAFRDKRITAKEIRLLGLLGYYGGNRHRGCWPSYNRLADELTTTRRTIMAQMKNLIDCGYVTKEKREREDGSQTSNIFRVKIDLDFGDLEDVVNNTPFQVSTSGSVNTNTPDGVDTNTPIMNHTNIEPDKGNHKVKINKKPTIVSLDQWEQNIGSQLNAEMISSWCKTKQLAKPIIMQLIEEFRIEMMGKGKQYADFRAAFQTYLTKGYLSKTLQGAQNLSKAVMTGTAVNNRGVNL